MHRQTRMKENGLALADTQAAYPQQNRLLASLPAADLAQLAPALQLVYLPLGRILYEPKVPLRYIYFPTDCIVSLVHALCDGASVGIAAIGNEGAVGVALITGAESMTDGAIVQSAGFAYRLTNGRLDQEFLRHGALFHVLLRYTQAFITQVAQNAACNRHHSIDQQLSRWLLASMDRVSSGKLTMTHGFLSAILGVRRESVSVAAGRLQKQGAISYTRGQITVLDRCRLEQLACECYGVISKETNRLLPLERRNSTLEARFTDGAQSAQTQFHPSPDSKLVGNCSAPPPQQQGCTELGRAPGM